MAPERCPHCGSEMCPECHEKRFKVGDRVLAKVDQDLIKAGAEDDCWRVGTISQIDWRGDDWRDDREASPYRILLDSSCPLEQVYVHAAADHDSIVRPFPENAQEVANLLCDRRKCAEAGERCPFHHVCDDKLKCPKYHFCGKEGRRKTRLLQKLAERQLREDTDSRRCQPCQDGDCEDTGEASIDSILAFVEGQHTPNSTGKTRKVQFGARRNQKGTKINAKDEELRGREWQGCECDCHAIAASGRKAVMEMLREGMDFSAVFTEDLFETADMDSKDQEELAAFKRCTLAAEVSMPQDSGLR